MIRICASRYPDQASYALMSAIKKARSSGRRCYLVVPAQYTVEAEQGLFAFLQTDVLMDIQIKSFHSLVREILQEGKGYRKPLLDEAGRAMVLRMIIEDPDKDWRSFPPSSRREGLIECLSSDLREYKEYGISPDLLEEIADSMEGAEDTAIKLREIAEIYRLYSDRLGDRLLDGDDQMRLAFDQLADLDLFQDVDFFFDNFHSMSKLELDAIRALEEKSCAMTFALCLDERMAELALQMEEDQKGELAAYDAVADDAEAFRISLSFLTRLKAIAGNRMHLEDCSDHPGLPKPIFRHAARSIFSYKAIKRQAEEGLTIREYRNTEAEIDGLLLSVKKKIREGVRYRDIQVILSDKDEYGPLIRQKFDLEEVPYFMDETRTINHHPLIRFIRSLLRIAGRGYRQMDVLDLLKTGFCDLEDEEVDLYQNFVLRRKLDGWKFLTEKSFEISEDYLLAHPREEEQIREEFKVAGQVNGQLMALTEDFVQAIKRKRKVRDFAELLYHCISQDAVLRSMDRFEEELEEDGDLEALEEHRQLWDALMKLIDQLVDLAGEREMDFDLFARLLDEGCSTISLGIIPPFQDRLIISELLRSRARARDHIYLLGMGDIYLPANRKQVRLLTQEEKALLREKGFFLPSMQEFYQQEEKLAVYRAFSRPSDELIVSYPIQNMANEPVRMSFWLQQMVRSFDRLAPEPIKEEPLDRLLDSLPLLAAGLSRAFEQPDPNDPRRMQAGSILNRIEKTERGAVWADLIRRARDYRTNRASLAEDIVSAIYGRSDRVSASQLEGYARCPYRYFVDYGLRPRELRTIDIDSRDMGNIAHGSIDLWTERAAGDPKSFRNLSEEETGAILEEAFDRMQKLELDDQKRDEARNRFVLALMAKTLREANSHLYRQLQNSDADRIFHEQAYGRSAAFPAIKLDLGGRRFYIEGRIDRIDSLHRQGKNYLQVIDYKSSKLNFDLSRFLGGIQLQLVLYLAAGTAGSDDGGKEQLPLGCFYLPITPIAAVDESQLDRVDKALAKEGLLSGVIRDDFDLVRSFDHSLLDDLEAKASGGPISKIYRYEGRSRSFGDKDNVLSRQQMDRLIDQAVRTARDLVGWRESGFIDVTPYRLSRGRSAETACDFCEYRSLCRFDKRLHYHKYRELERKDWKSWKEEGHD